jgi:CRP-like cAMP-binding protein
MPPSPNVRLQYAPGEPIAIEDGILYLCVEGQVVLSIVYESGDEAILGLISPGMPFGEPLGGTESYVATALTAVRVQALTVRQVFDSPPLGRQLVEALIERVRLGEALIAVANQRRVEERFRALLLLLAGQFGRETNEGVYLEIRLTHRQLASAINTTRVTVTRLIQQYRQMGLIADHQQQILIRDLPQLKRLPVPHPRPRPVDPA